jgi:regulator of RNase E activity RraA
MLFARSSSLLIILTVLIAFVIACQPVPQPPPVEAAKPAAAADPLEQSPSSDPLIAGFQKTTVASVSDAVDRVTGKRGFMSHDMRAYVGKAFVGRAVTSLSKPAKPETATPTRALQHSVELIDSAQPGEVGVIVIEDGLDVAALGGLMATSAKARGMAGMILDGSVRDIGEIRRLGLPVFARGAVPSTAVGRFATVSRNEPVKCGGVIVSPGDIIVAGEDGVVVVPKDKAEEVLKVAQEIDERETKMVPHIQKEKSLGKTIALFNRI